MNDDREPADSPLAWVLIFGAALVIIGVLWIFGRWILG